MATKKTTKAPAEAAKESVKEPKKPEGKKTLRITYKDGRVKTINNIDRITKVNDDVLELTIGIFKTLEPIHYAKKVEEL